MKSVHQFLVNGSHPSAKYNAVSLFSGAGLSDYGYCKSGFTFVVQAELNAYRAAIGKDNFPESKWVVGDVCSTWKEIVLTYKASTDCRLDPVNRKELTEHSWPNSKRDASLLDHNIRTIRNALSSTGIEFARVDAKGWILRETSGVGTADGVSPHSYGSATAARITIFPNWDLASPLISSATRSVLIVDSYYSQYRNLSSDLAKAIQGLRASRPSGRTKKLDLTLYMLSPAGPFGVQREREIEKPRGTLITYKKRLTQDPSDEESDKYTRNFWNYVKGFRQLAIGRPINTPKIYEYFAMPSIRMILVDDRHYLFGWFPLWAYNPDYVCLYMDGAHRFGCLAVTGFEVVPDLCIRGLLQALRAKSGIEGCRDKNGNNGSELHRQGTAIQQLRSQKKVFDKIREGNQKFVIRTSPYRRPTEGCAEYASLTA